jgi:hypothetical protein
MHASFSVYTYHIIVAYSMNRIFHYAVCVNLQTAHRYGTLHVAESFIVFVYALPVIYVLQEVS